MHQMDITLDNAFSFSFLFSCYGIDAKFFGVLSKGDWIVMDNIKEGKKAKIFIILCLDLSRIVFQASSLCLNHQG